MNNNNNNKFCTTLRRCLLPLSSLLTVAVVSYISYSYLWYYLPALIRAADINREKVKEGDLEHLEVPGSVLVLGAIFVMHPIFIFWTLGAIVCGDPGLVTRELVDKQLEGV